MNESIPPEESTDASRVSNEPPVLLPENEIGNSVELVDSSDKPETTPVTEPSPVADENPNPGIEAVPAVSFDFKSEDGFATLRIPVGETRLQSLPNQKVGEEFSEVIDEIKEFEKVEVSDLPAGIFFEAETRALKGCPSVPGHYKVRFLCRPANGNATFLEFSLVVVPDPKSLWKNIPTDKSAPFWKSDYAAEIDSTTNLFVVASSNRGRSHAHEGKFREDDYSILCVGAGAWSVLCVADGAGSAALSRRGSEVASKTATKKLASLLETHLSPLLDNYEKPVSDIEQDQEINTALYKSLIQAAYDAAVEVEKEAKTHGVETRAMSTTLLLVAVKKFSIGHVVVGFNIGDGASGVIYNDQKDLYLLCIPEGGDFAGQTKFLHKDEFKEENKQGSRLRIAVLPSFDSIAVMSDGVSDAKFPSDNALHEIEHWQKLIYEDWMPSVLPEADPNKNVFPTPSEEIKKRANDWLDYWAVGTHDDRTLVVAFPKDAK